MKNKKPTYQYEMKHQLGGYFKVVQYKITDMGVRKKTIRKNLTMTEAENLIYKLESR